MIWQPETAFFNNNSVDAFAGLMMNSNVPILYHVGDECALDESQLHQVESSNPCIQAIFALESLEPAFETATPKSASSERSTERVAGSSPADALEGAHRHIGFLSAALSPPRQERVKCR